MQEKQRERTQRKPNFPKVQCHKNKSSSRGQIQDAKTGGGDLNLQLFDQTTLDRTLDGGFWVRDPFSGAAADGRFTSVCVNFNGLF